MRTHAPRLAVVAVACASSIALSGCLSMIIQDFGNQPSDPPVHRGGHDIGASPGTASATGRAFTGRASGELASRMKITDFALKTKTSWARFFGSYKSSLTDSPLASAEWRGRFRAVRNRDTGKFTVTGLVIATFDDASAGRACLSLRHAGRRKQNRRPTKPGLSKLSVLGGQGDARTLRGTANVRVRLVRSGFRLRGRVKERRGTDRGFTPACTKLEKKVGLTPLD